MPLHPSNAPTHSNATHHFKIKHLFHLEPIRIVIGLTIMLCMLWFFIVFILYQLSQIATNHTIQIHR